MPTVFESIRYEAYGPGGVALIIDCCTDNRDRTIGQLRQIVREHGGQMGAHGSVSYLFNEVGRLIFPAGTDAKGLARVSVQAGAEEVIAAALEVLTDPIDFDAVRAALEAAGFVPSHAVITQRASITVPLNAAAAVTMLHLVESLKELKDVENVYTNAQIPDEVLARL